jgi:hypothetical protein
MRGDTTPRGGQAPYQVTPSRSEWVARGRPANRSQASTGAAADYGARPPPGVWVSAGAWAEVGVDLAGVVALEAADDFFMYRLVCCAVPRRRGWAGGSSSG